MKKDKINDYVNLVKDAGLEAVVVDVDAFALANMCELNYEVEAGITALLNIGASVMNINILRDGVSIFTRDIMVGGNKYTEALHRDASLLSYEDAEKVKRGEAVDGADREQLLGIMSSVTEEIVAQIQQSFDFFRSTTGRDKVNHVLVSGGCAKIAQFIKVLSERIEIPVDVINPSSTTSSACGAGRSGRRSRSDDRGHPRRGGGRVAGHAGARAARPPARGSAQPRPCTRAITSPFATRSMGRISKGTIDPLGCLALAGELAGDREDIREALDILKSWYRDLLVFKETGRAEALINRDHAGDIGRLAGQAGVEEILRGIRTIQRAEAAIERNVNKPLTLETMVFTLFANKANFVEDSSRGRSGR